MCAVSTPTQKRPGKKQGERDDFTETVYWHANLQTDPSSGQGKITFALSDSVTAFQIRGDAFDSKGHLGQGIDVLNSVEPFYLEAKFPLQVTSGDVVQLPVAIINSTVASLTAPQLSVHPGAGMTVGKISGPRRLEANSRSRFVVPLTIGNAVGKTDVVVAAKAGNYADKVTRTLDVQPLGFPSEVAYGGVLNADATANLTLEIPQTVVPGSIKTRAAVLPTPLANMTTALERLIREPNGCFEQTSSTNYPLVMAQQYFTSHSGVDPALIERSRTLLQRGYARLLSFECKQGGYEWFGDDPGHEALSAYGLMQFHDMSKLQQVDSAMLDRTRAWLLGKRDGKGGFTHARRALHTWLTDPAVHSSYITWALLEAKESALEREIEHVTTTALDSQNSYVIALAANVAQLAKQDSTGKRLMDKLASYQTQEGWVDGATMSIVGSRGDALKIETTALATLAWLRDTKYVSQVEQAIKWLAEMSKGGRYGSTQSTVLALRAIIAYDQARARPKAAGSVQLWVDGQPVGEPFTFDAQTSAALTLPSFAERLGIGNHRIQLKMQDGSDMPFTIAVEYHALQPDASEQARLSVQTTLPNRQVAEGDITEVKVVVQNLSQDVLPTPVAIIGIPGGLEVRHDQLKELRKAQQIAAYEVLGREVVLYWRQLAAGQTVRLPLSLVAAIPGSYRGPASRVYEYYTDEFKRWAPGLQINILPKQ
ncbi:MAG: alpha-2-macroglobulin family protein [Myxococcota bacterium]